MVNAAASEPVRYRQAMDACRDVLFWAFLFSAAVNLLYLSPSLFMLQVYDRVLTTGGLATLGFVSIILLYALGTLTFLDMLRGRLMTRLSLRLERMLAPVLLEVAMRREAKDGEAARRQVMREFDLVRQTVTGGPANALMDAPWTPIFILVCFLIHPLIGVVTAGGGALLLLLAWRNEHVLRKGLAELSELTPRIYADQEADGASADAVRAMGMRSAVIERRLKQRSDLNTLQTTLAHRAAVYTALTKWLRLTLQSTALGVGAYLAVERQISPGSLIAGSILASRTLGPLEQIVGAWRQIGQARNALRSIKEAIASAPANEGMALPSPRGAVRVERISVRLRGAERPALQDVSFAIEPCEVVGVIGPSGAGKSTLARVVAGALAPQVGIVRLDGANLQDWEPDSLGRHIGYIPQEIGLLDGTIAENIRRFAPALNDDPNAVDPDVIEAAKAAGAHDFILRFPKGYHYQLGRGGVGVSPGQAQRIALARALYRSPSLLVLDEPNAHLDQEGENALIEALRAARARGAATLLVAHRAGVMALADRLLVLRDGRLEMQGGRDEVVRKLAGPASEAREKVGT
ncbi:MAG TPA: type I secretion system permease/ATPase [Caulobacterales bacterium]|nr:type I secretion system permease/ATPase [Caulobacterales bacterium]